MQVQWQKLILKTATWLAAEIILSALGLDNLADYSEFLQQGHATLSIPAPVPQIVLDK